MYTPTDILSHFDPKLEIEKKQYFPKTDNSYHFWIDLEHPYCHTAGSRLHLYADKERWALVGEKNGYFNRSDAAGIDLYLFGNCINYQVLNYGDHTNTSNVGDVELISGEEFERICNPGGEHELDDFEVISPDADYVTIRDTQIPIEQDIAKYRALGINSRKDYEDVSDLITFEDLIRYYSDTNPEVLYATEDEIRQWVPADLPKIITIDRFHFTTTYQDYLNPSQEELYQLIANVLYTQDASQWKPTQPANNHWSNWESGHL